MAGLKYIPFTTYALESMTSPSMVLFSWRVYRTMYIKLYDNHVSIYYLYQWHKLNPLGSSMLCYLPNPILHFLPIRPASMA